MIYVDRAVLLHYILITLYWFLVTADLKFNSFRNLQTRQGQCMRAKLVYVTVCVCTRYAVHHVKICIILCKLYFIKEGSQR